MEFYESEQREKLRKLFPHYNYGNNSEYYIFTCPHCHGEKRVRKEPVTATACTYWSDGKVECCNSPQVSFMQRCPHCSSYYYIVKDEAQTGLGCDPEDDGCLDIGEYAALIGNGELMSAYEPGIVATLFMQYVQQYNDVYRREERSDKKASYEQSRMFTEAVLFLTAHCHIPDILISDLYRQAGMFKKSLEYSSRPTIRIEEWERETLDRIRYLAIKGETAPFITRTIL